MPLYISYVSTTQRGAETFKEGPKRSADVRKWIESAGGRVLGAYATMGDYDYVWITEFPDDKAGWAVLAKIAMMGTVKTHTVQAIPLNEFYEIVGRAV